MFVLVIWHDVEKEKIDICETLEIRDYFYVFL